MRSEALNKSLSSLTTRNLWLTVTTTVLSVVVLMLAFSVIGKHERIVVIPPGLTGETTIGWNNADAQYMTTMATAFAVMTGSINPKNIQATVERLSALSDPRFYSELKKKLLARTLDPSYAQSGVSTIFMPTVPPIFEAEEGIVYVIGEENINTGFGTAKTTPYIYEVGLRIIEGRPVVNSIKNYPGTEPHTKKWREEHPDKVKANQ